MDQIDREFYEEFGLEFRKIRWALEHLVASGKLFQDEQRSSDLTVLQRRDIGHGPDCKLCADPDFHVR
jgi:hypothetical protein